MAVEDWLQHRLGLSVFYFATERIRINVERNFRVQRWFTHGQH